MPLLWLRSLHSARRTKSANACLEIRNEFSVMRARSVDPTIMPSRTLQSLGSPSHPSRFLPSKSGRNPSSADAASEASNSSAASLPISSAPLDLQRPDLHVFLGPVLRAAGNFGDFPHDVITLDHLAEHAVPVIEPRRGSDSDEELAAVGVGPGVGHGQD